MVGIIAALSTAAAFVVGCAVIFVGMLVWEYDEEHCTAWVFVYWMFVISVGVGLIAQFGH